MAAGYAQRYALDTVRFARIDANQTPDRVWLDVLGAVRSKGFLP